MESVEELCDNITLINRAKCILNGNINDIRAKFKSNTYQVTFHGRFERNIVKLSANCEFFDEQITADRFSAKVRLCNGLSTNDLLSALLPAGNICSFNEVVPGMRDIFLKVVKDTEE